MAEDDLRFLLQIGDWGYPDQLEPLSHPADVFGLDPAKIQKSYRARYDTSHTLQKVLRTMPVDYVYDDHDYMKDDASGTSYPIFETVSTVTVSDTARRNHIKAYQEFFPGYTLANSNGGIWHKFTCGNIDVFMLDTRSQRDPNLDAFTRNTQTDSIEFSPDETHSMLAGNPELIGEDQMAWLLRELEASTADWKFIASTVPFNKGLNNMIDLGVSLQDSVAFVPGQGDFKLLNIALQLADKWAASLQINKNFLIISHKTIFTMLLS